MNRSGPLLGTMRTPFTLAFVLLGICACQGRVRPHNNTDPMTDPATTLHPTTLDTAVFGAGCFWCVEAVFSELNGVIEVTSGYAGGHVKNPSYKEVCAGTTGHAEVAHIVYDPSRITFDELLEVFWQTHDPTTLNRQGADVGTQYRSAIFATSTAQRELAASYKAKLDASGAFPAPIVTEITELTAFYPAEDHHQDYYAQNADQGYCQLVIRPKLEKFRKVFAEKLKP